MSQNKIIPQYDVDQMPPDRVFGHLRCFLADPAAIPREEVDVARNFTQARAIILGKSNALIYNFLHSASLNKAPGTSASEI